MLLTEADAKLCECRTSLASSASPTNPEQPLCVASRCMMWRWGTQVTPPHPEQGELRKGYCGLAGVPGWPE